MKIALALLLTSTAALSQTRGVSQTTADGEYNISSLQAYPEDVQRHLSPSGRESYVGNFVDHFDNAMCVEYRDLSNVQGPPQQMRDEEAKQVTQLFEDSYGRALKENPELLKNFKADIEKWRSQENCSGNAISACRAKLVAIYSYYTKYVRPSLDYCPASGDTMKVAHCSIEKDMWNKPLRGIVSNGGLPGPDTYLKEIAERVKENDQWLKSYMLRDKKPADQKFLKRLMKSDDSIQGRREIRRYVTTLSTDWLHCEPRQNTERQNAADFLPQLLFVNPSYSGMSVKPVPVKVVPIDTPKKVELTTPKGEPCKEEQKVEKEANVFADFETGESILSQKQIDDVVAGVAKLRSENANLTVTDIVIYAVSSNSPFGSCKGAEDPESCNYTKNLALANKRAESGQKAVGAALRKDVKLANASISFGGKVGGPAYSALDDDLKRMKISAERISEMKARYESIYASEAIMDDAQMSEPTKMKNMFDVKFKAFQGFKIVIKGFDSKIVDCADRKGVEASGKKTEEKSSGSTGAKTE